MAVPDCVKGMAEAVALRSRKERRRIVVLTLTMLVPLFVMGFFFYNARPNSPAAARARSTSSALPSIDHGRLVVIIIDSLRRQAVEELMPNLKAFAQRSDVTFLDVQTAGGNMTLPCIQTLMEGRESPYVSGIHNFTGARSFNNSLPAAAARAGFGTAVIGDFVVTGLYGPYATVSIDISTLPGGTETIACDLCVIEKAKTVLSDQNIRVMVLHLPGTDHVAHKYKPGHPEYELHYREVDAKLPELFRLLDLKKDHLIITGDHGHNDVGNHVPHSVAIFAGGIYPQLFPALRLTGELQQTDMLFFMAFPLNLPLPVEYEGRYFGLEKSDDVTAALPEIRTRLLTFGDLQKETLAAAGFDDVDLTTAIAAQRRHTDAAATVAFKKALPLLILFFVWIVLAFHLNEIASLSLWPLAALTLAAIALWFFVPPIIGSCLAVAVAAFSFSTVANQRRRFSFLALLIFAAAFTAYVAENWPQKSIPLQVALAISGALLALVRGGGVSWLLGLGAVCLFALPSGVYPTQFGFNILRGFFFAYGITFIWLIFVRRFRRFDLAGRDWVSVLVLIASAGLLLFQQSHGWGWHSLLLDWLNSARGSVIISALFYAACASYLIWVVRCPRVVIAMLLSILPLYCCWFAELPMATLAVTSIVPVFLASGLAVTTASPRLRDDIVAEECFGLLLVATLFMAFWILFQGFLIQNVDFAFAMKYFGESASEKRLFVFLYPLTLLKYGLPLALIVLVYFALAPPQNASRVVVASLIFCNFKLATLLVQILVGPLHSHQKLYELAMSDFAFVSQVELILALSYLVFLAASALNARLASESIRRSGPQFSN